MLSYFLIGMMVVVGIVPMLWEMYKNRFDFFNLKNPFIIYFLLQLAISGLVTLLTGNPSELGLDTVGHSQTYELTFAISLIGLCLFQLGYYTHAARPIKIPILLKRPWNRYRYRLVVGIFLALGFCAFIMLMQTYGGLAGFLEDREVFRAGGMVGKGVLIYPATSLMALAALIYFLGKVQENATRQAILKSIFVLIIALLPAFVMGFRSHLILPVLQFMVLWHYAYRRIQPGKLIILMALIVTIFTLYGLNRQIPHDVSVSPSLLIDVVVENPELAYAVVSRSKGTEVVATVIDTLNRTGDYDLGWKSLFESATIVIPRAIWEDKPQASSVRFTTYFFANALLLTRNNETDALGGVSPTVVGELYWHFGWIGVSLGLYFLGKLARMIYSTLQLNPTNPGVLIVYATLYTSFAMFAEALQGYVNSLVMYGFVIIVTLHMLTNRTSSNQRALG